MDRSERKRKRAEKAEASRAGDQIKGKEEAAAAAEEEEVAAPPPTEEEVEEFFAILRRMRVAVKYFEKEGIKSKGGSDETPTVAAPADGGGKWVAENGGLDLNAVPEAEVEAESSLI